MNEPVAVIVNTSGGTASSLGDKLEATVRAAFAGQEIDLRLVEGKHITEAVKAAAGRSVVAIGGGDGTQGSAAATFASSETAQIVLPLGTRNHLAKQLGMPADLAEAAKVAVGGKAEQIDLAKGGERVFVNNASIGLYTKLVRERDRRWGPKWLGTIPATWIVLRTLRAKPMMLCIDGRRERVVTPLLFIGNNRYSLEAGSVGQRESLSDGVLSLFVVAQASPLALIAFAFRALLGKADGERDFCALADAKEVVVEGRGAIDVAFDGEVERMALPLTFAIMPGALKVLVPHEAASPDAPPAGGRERQSLNRLPHRSGEPNSLA
ncbi:diacylglycerol kinase family protein [Novosphingobium sp. Gsoil 351]|uniref:diacylglycerol/lipid kinase family protein n=1 Tax=Novosphingobium sp. Gsoil 351 TaxID=2675225 RepID=UPI0012B4EF70|nr:diacylglycerol kinase family protein [Novosphingobium sp. Gsoil 351]QGN53639.1 sphingosine kinase [Novosphingobium sp. Gsoil 351]